MAIEINDFASVPDTAAGQKLLRVRVRAVRQHTPNVKAFELVSDDASPLPSFDAGAHVNVCIPSSRHGQLSRSYSLVNRAEDEFYEIAVQRDANSTGGSVWMHTLKVGDCLSISTPQNAFPLHCDPDTPSTLLIAGGIGITPILCMARELLRQGRNFELHYAVRNPEDMAYYDEVQAMDQASLYFDGGDRRKGLPLEALLASSQGRHVYVCGPSPLIQAVLSRCTENDWSVDAVHYEMFTGSLERAGDRGFELEMRSSGLTVEVPPNMSILDVAISQGVFAPFECRRGECGMCLTPILEGDVEHRDSYLTEQEHKTGNAMCICVSRTAGSRLVLDI